MRELIIGTAGHVDHGKTSFIKALTGIDTDRLKEEKQRGITIELGFAHVDLPCGHRLGIVDVPGHEKFIRNMVAGASGMDMVAFIIAADEGIMPQTTEHFDICRLLGIRDGLIILTKVDLVEEDWLEMVEEEIREFFTGSFLEDAPLLRVAAPTGEGIPEVIAELDSRVREQTFQEEFGPFRLAVDRIFSMKGFGSVITGTSISGRVAVGDELTLYPSGVTARIRGIQVHGETRESIEAGHRTAINLQGIDKEEIQRGDIAATPGCMLPSTLLDVDLHTLASNPGDLKNRAQVRVHVGTREIPGRIILMEDDVFVPGQSGHAQILLQEPVALWPGDRYVIRGYSPTITLGGGVVFNNAPKKRKRASEKDRAANKEIFTIYETDDPVEKIRLFLDESGSTGITGEQLGTRVGVFGKRLKKLLQGIISSGEVLVVNPETQRLLSLKTYEELKEKFISILQQYHEDQPLKTGMGKEELRSTLIPPVDTRLFQFLLTTLDKKQEIEQDGSEVRLAGFTVVLHVDQEAMQHDLGERYLQAGLQPPNMRDVFAQFADFPQDQIEQVITLLQQKGALVRLTEALLFHQEVIAKLTEEVRAYLQEHGEIDAQGFKQLTGLSRKFSIPLLEYFDKEKLTVRVGDKRVLRKQR